MSGAQHERDDFVAGESKAAIRHRLPSMLEAITQGGAAAVAALRACCIVEVRPPIELLKAENIRSLSTEEIVRMFSKLGETKTAAECKHSIDSST